MSIDLETHLHEPVVIQHIELQELNHHRVLRSISRQGVVGATLCDQRMPHLVSLLRGIVLPFFLGKDARRLPELVEQVYRHGSNYKYAGMPFWNCVGSVELSLWDLLGKTAGQPVWRLLGDKRRDRIAFYLSSFGRTNTPEQEITPLLKKLEATGCTAVKLKIGGRLGEDLVPGRTEALIPYARKALGDQVTIYVDANGSYSAQRAIEVGQLLQDHEVGWFEEPCLWEDHEATKQVADALDMPVAGGEQDSSWFRFRWMIQNRAVDVVQPDVLYNGGLIRALRVARLAEEHGLLFAPHSPRAGAMLAPLLHLAAVVPNLASHLEHHAHEDPQAFPGYQPWMRLGEGHLPVPDGPGLGIDLS